MISGKVAMGIPKFKCSEIPVLQENFPNDNVIIINQKDNPAVTVSDFILNDVNFI